MSARSGDAGGFGSTEQPPEKPHRPGNRFALRNWRLRSKQTVVLLVPILTALVLGLLRVSTELANADEFSRTVTQVDLSATVSDLVHEIQTERDLVVGQIADGGTGTDPAVTAQVQDVDAGVERLRRSSAAIAELDQGVRDLFAKATYGLGTLDSVRAFASGSAYPAADALAVYERVVGSLLQLGREVTRVSDDRAISRQANTFDALARAKEHVAMQNSILRAAAMSGTFGTDQLSRLRSAQAKFTAALSDFEGTADPVARARYASTVAGPEVDERLRLQQIAQNRGDANAPVDIRVDQLDPAANGTLKKLRQVEIASLDDVRETASGLITVARNNAIRDGALIGGALVLAMLFMLLVTRSLVHPLRVLRASALDVAYRRLPETVRRILADPDPVRASRNAVEPVPVFTREETGEVARSFDAVHDQAVRMATEQALLRDNINSIFVNLSRRSQVLVERLLSVIDQLEREELDPDELANLFEMDHLATRMRRNSESLLVLSGSGLRREYDKPLPVADVLGAAISEVEHYQRIDFVSAAEVAVVGRVVNELVHLIAELLDNATFFSESDRKVAVRVLLNRSQELVIRIIDRGIGMSEQEVAEANARLADPPTVDVSVTKRMGLYVVARLSKRHGIAVRLHANEDIEGGLIARIIVPSGLVLPIAHPAPTVPHRPGGWATGPPPTSPAHFTGPPSFPPPTSPAHFTGPPTNPPPTSPPHLIGLAAAFPASYPSQELPAIPASREPEDSPTPPPADTRQSDVGSMRYRYAAQGRHTAVDEAAQDPPTERLPVYEAVLSRWFKVTETGPQPPAHLPSPLPAPSPPAAEPEPEPPVWTSPADEGWRAAQTILDAPAAEDTTSAGLPKRVPRSRLMPGSATPQEPEVDAVPLPPRSASAVRNRMSSYQRGVRRGRHALGDNFNPPEGSV